MYIANRERSVLLTLLHAQEEIPMKKLASILGVSVRTIYRDLKNLEGFLSQYHLELSKKAGIGLSLTGKQTDKQSLEFSLTETEVIDHTPDERQIIILVTLLEMNEPIKLLTLANELNVTIATISHDLDQIENQLLPFHLTLIRKRGYGVEIIGGEIHKRAAISKLITEHVDPLVFVSRVKKDMKKQRNQMLKVIQNRLLGSVDTAVLQMIEDAVAYGLGKLPNTLTDESRIGIVVHLALVIERLKHNDTIQFNHTIMQDLMDTREFTVAQDILDYLGDTLSITFPEAEIGYITMHLRGAKRQRTANTVIEASSLDIAYKTGELIQFISDALVVDLTKDMLLLNDLITHIKPTIYRLDQGMMIHNPLLDVIKRDYPDLFQILRQGVEHVFPNLNFPEDEIGYLVLHFAAVLTTDDEDMELTALAICSSGIGSAKILATNVMKYVNEIKHVENISLFDLPVTDVSTYDVIISTVPLDNPELEYIHASPILTNQDIKQIKQKVRTRKLAKRKQSYQRRLATKQQDQTFLTKLEALQSYTDTILALQESFYVEKVTQEGTLPNLIHFIGGILERRQILSHADHVVGKLIDREKAGGLGIPGTSLALFHTRSVDIEKVCFTVYPLVNPLMVQGMDGHDVRMDTVLLMLAPEQAENSMLEVLSHISSLIIQEKECVTVLSSGNEDKIRAYLSGQWQLFLREKKLL